jgi:uncharacterized protein YkwD
VNRFLFLLLIPGLAPAANSASQHPFAEKALLENLNTTRSEHNLSPLRRDRVLDRLARELILEVLATSEPQLEPLVGDVFHERAKRSGYEALFISEMLVEVEGDEIAGVAASWTKGSVGRDLALRPDVLDVGLAIGRAGSSSIYLFLFAQSKADDFKQRTRKLPDAAQLKEKMLECVNAIRQSAHLTPLRWDDRLGQAAQKYAEEMLARVFFGHANPEGAGPLHRARAVGYVPWSVGENIARGHYSVDEVMDGWMNSPPHRHEILDPNFDEVGFGLARGRNAEGHQVYWVQLFGKRKP